MAVGCVELTVKAGHSAEYSRSKLPDLSVWCHLKTVSSMEAVALNPPGGRKEVGKVRAC